MSLLPARIKKIESKMKSLEWPQNVSHYKSMEIFPDAQGQVTLQSVIGSGRISNSFETLLLSLLPARMKMIRSKIKALEWPQDYMSIFQTLKDRQLHSHWWDLAEKRLCMSLLPAKIKKIQ